MDKDCIICGKPLEYLTESIMMECEICKTKESSKTRCVDGHYICNSCHMKGLTDIIDICLSESSKNPIKIINRIMSEEFCHMHGPEHHTIVGASLLTAYYNAGGDINLKSALLEMIDRASNVPGGICGFWGACGAAISSGIFISIISQSTPLAGKPFSLSNMMTSKSLEKIAVYGGPRCCKRDSYLSIIEAISFVEENFGISMEKEDIKCIYSSYNKQCLKDDCPFYKKEGE